MELTTQHFSYVANAAGNLAIKSTQHLVMKRIMIVDDSPIIVRNISELIDEVRDGVLSIQGCYNYAEALISLHSFKPNVVLLDIDLPDRSGIELLQYIKKHFEATIVLMVTNQDHQYYKTLCYNLGADYFFDKSNDFHQIPDVIGSIEF